METNKETGGGKDEVSIRQYLLGVLADPEADHLEQRCAEDEALFEEMQEVEDELIDDYAAGALTGQDRTRFEEYFLRLPERREKLQFALAITEHAAGWKKQMQVSAPPIALVTEPSLAASEDDQDPRSVLPFRRLSYPVPAWRQWLAIAAALLIAVGACALWLQNRDLRHELLSANAEEARLQSQADSAVERAEQAEMEAAAEKKLRQEQAAAQMQESRMVHSLGTVIEFLGLANLLTITRSGPVEAKTIRVPSDARTVQLNVEFEATRFQRFTATLQFRKRDIWTSSTALQAREAGEKQSLVLRIPARSLRPGAYELIIRPNEVEDKDVDVRYLLNIVH